MVIFSTIETLGDLYIERQESHSVGSLGNFHRIFLVFGTFTYSKTHVTLCSYLLDESIKLLWEYFNIIDLSKLWKILSKRVVWANTKKDRKGKKGKCSIILLNLLTWGELKRNPLKDWHLQSSNYRHICCVRLNGCNVHIKWERENSKVRCIQ